MLIITLAHVTFAPSCQAFETEYQKDMSAGISEDQQRCTWIKQEFEKLHGHFWHVIIGKNFGSSVTHEAKMFTFFYIGQMGVLMYKAG